MNTNSNQYKHPDPFEAWVRSCPAEQVPAALRERCLATIPETMISPSLNRGRSRGVAWSPNTRRILSAAALVAAIVAAIWLTAREPPLLLAEAVEKTKGVAALHMVQTLSDPKLRPGEVGTSEWWIVRGVGFRRESKTNGKPYFRCTHYEGMATIWTADENEVVIEPSTMDLQGAVAIAWSNSIRLRDYERKAKEQGVPVQVQDLEQSGRAIRRVKIGQLALVDKDGLGTISDIEVDIDAVTQLVLRWRTTDQAVGDHATLPDGRKVEIIERAFDNPTHEFVFDYPDPNSVPLSRFKLDFPADVKRSRYDAPTPVREDRQKLEALANAIQQYRATYGDRLPQFVSELQPYLKETNPAWVLITSDEQMQHLNQPGYSSWTFYHAGEKCSDFKEPDQAVIAEHWYPGGFRLLLYASGRIGIGYPPRANGKQGPSPADK